MLSICIPIYNFDVTVLVKDLHEQGMQLNIPFEILLMDDESTEEYQMLNSNIHLSNLRYIQLENNVGRSKIRNKLAENAKYPFLIFMDCDSAVSSDNYIKNYLPYLKSGIVCYGGRTYKPERPDGSEYLRWKYGVERESILAEQRRENPNFGFESNNFLIDKQVFEEVRFEESLEGYGHEDTFFGIKLLMKGINIEHIDNPLIHIGLESAEVFLKKTKNAVLNLYKVDHTLRKEFGITFNYSRLVNLKRQIEKLKCTMLAKGLYKLFKSRLESNLLGENPSLICFDIYKLGFFCMLDTKN